MAQLVGVSCALGVGRLSAEKLYKATSSSWSCIAVMPSEYLYRWAFEGEARCSRISLRRLLKIYVYVQVSRGHVPHEVSRKTVDRLASK